MKISLYIREHYGIPRIQEPVRIGVPIPKTMLFQIEQLQLEDDCGNEKLLQAKPLAKWSDGSIKWVLVDFYASLPGKTEVVFYLCQKESHGKLDLKSASFEKKGKYLIYSSPLFSFQIDSTKTCGLASAVCNERELIGKGLNLQFRDSHDGLCKSYVEDFAIKELGPIRFSFQYRGCFKDSQNTFLCNYNVVISFFLEQPLISLEILIHNPKRAGHPRGEWDLGDKGSVFFKDLSLVLDCEGSCKHIEWQSELGKTVEQKTVSKWLLYQDSSGGENWNSPNHVDHKGNLMVSSPGYRIADSYESMDKPNVEGKRATPWVRRTTPHGSVGIAIQNFWQNFPKALRVYENRMEVGLFPNEAKSEFELQGGEQKRHNVFIHFNDKNDDTVLAAVQHPLLVYTDPDWVEKSGTVSNFVSLSLLKFNKNNKFTGKYLDYINSCIEGQNSFFKKRELIDEYGWRNFGDLYADHEAVYHQGTKPFISHYNNQFDFVFGALYHFMGSGDRRWYELSVDAARHMIDIDIYRTDQDRPAYNYGLFWHTDHHCNAATASHRTYSKSNRTGGENGGGPSNEHNYSTGLLYYYYLTGDNEAKATVVSLAEWVIAMDDGSNSLFSFFDDGPTGLASQTVSCDYHKPGRGAGNSINSLLDAYQLTKNQKYMVKAEELIQRTIHPDDDLNVLGLDEPEYRWSYLVFLQILGKYLDLKCALNEKDFRYYYARESLLHYVRWMDKHEVPYKEILDKVELPTETWSAQDIRKSHIFYYASKYCPDNLRQAYRLKAQYFWERCIDDLLSFPTSHYTRPQVIITVYAGMVTCFHQNKTDYEPYHEVFYDFGGPTSFIPQRNRFKATARKRLFATLASFMFFALEKFKSLKKDN